MSESNEHFEFDDFDDDAQWLSLEDLLAEEEQTRPKEEMSSDTRAAYSRWIRKGDNVYIPSDNVQVVEQLESGAYKIGFSHRDDTFIITKMTVATDELIDIPQPEMIEVMDAVNEFYEQQPMFAKWKFIFKRGFLLYGVPGGGKTSIIANIMKYVTEEKGGIAFVIYDLDDLEYYSRFMKTVYRDIEPDRLVLAIFEDIDGMTKNETLLINTLDGLGNGANILNIATTNYTERLSERLINRPNRFDRRWEIKSPNAEARKIYFEKKILPEVLEGVDIAEWVKQTDKMTLAQLSELIKSVFVLGANFLETVDILRGFKKIPDSTQYNKEAGGLGFKGVGFGKEESEEVKDAPCITISSKGVLYRLTSEEYNHYIKHSTLLDTVYERESKSSASAGEKE